MTHQLKCFKYLWDISHMSIWKTGHRRCPTDAIIYKVALVFCFHHKKLKMDQMGGPRWIFKILDLASIWVAKLNVCFFWLPAVAFISMSCTPWSLKWLSGSITKCKTFIEHYLTWINLPQIMSERFWFGMIESRFSFWIILIIFHLILIVYFKWCFKSALWRNMLNVEKWDHETKWEPFMSETPSSSQLISMPVLWHLI